ncbi:hypothetical protein AYK25_00505 [Thermoplasmatales archaeon SM1-50]|nr:MAG: hypothetical protein AYK25_00505 [Thermoplasmatales archaeon SM1-50]
MIPLSRELVRVYFHGTYEENYSDSFGYYYETDIPLCYCLKTPRAQNQVIKQRGFCLASVRITPIILILPLYVWILTRCLLGPWETMEYISAV